MSGNAADRGKVVEHRQYDSFGKILARTANLSPGAATLPGSGVGVAFGYTGRPIDEKTGLSDYRARWYDANTGRFVNEDPSGFAGGDTNLFRYVGNDPLDRVDPSGLTAKWAGYGGKGSVPAAGWGAYGAGTLVTSGASNSTPTPFVMARAKSSPSFESPFLSGTKAFFGSISDSIVGGVTGLVTGEAGRQLGERAFQITVNNNGGKFNGQWGQVAYNIAGQMAGTHAMAEGAVGIDLASHEAVAAEDRVGRFVGGLGQFAGIAAGGAVMTRSAFGASAFTNLPGSAAVSRLSSSLNSAAGRVWSRVDDWAGVGKNVDQQAPRATRQTYGTGSEWYEHFAGRYGSQNVDWVSGSGRTVTWPSELPVPQSTQMFKVPTGLRSSTFLSELEGVAGPRPAGGIGHHVQPLSLQGVDNGSVNGAWVLKPAHTSGHAKFPLNRILYGMEIRIKPLQ